MKHVLFLLLVLAPALNCLFIPEERHHAFQQGDVLDVETDSLRSIHRQVSMDYYDLPLCSSIQQSDGEDGNSEPRKRHQTMGQYLMGNRIQKSPYKIQVLVEGYCEKVCMKRLTKHDAETLDRIIRQQYHANLILDNLPSGHRGLSTRGYEITRYSGGFDVGFMLENSNSTFLLNHLNFYIDFHPVIRNGRTEYEIIQFAVKPVSVNHKFSNEYSWDGLDNDEWRDQKLKTCEQNTHMETPFNTDQIQEVKEGAIIMYTYDVIWRQTDVNWSSRWLIYITEDYMVPNQVHYYSITNSAIILLLLGGMITAVWIRRLKPHIRSGYNALTQTTEQTEEAERRAIEHMMWRHLFADVFRPPSTLPLLFCVLVGTGAQLAVTSILTLSAAAAGFLNPSLRGSFLTALLVFYTLSGFVAGYVSNWLYKSLGGKRSGICTLATATSFPGVLFFNYLCFHALFSRLKSTSAAPLLVLVQLALLFFAVLIPLSCTGSYYGNRADGIQFPNAVDPVPRSIPSPSSCLKTPYVFVVCSGLLTFGASYVELFFVMANLWRYQTYSVFGIALIVFLVMIATSCMTTVLHVYFQLCAENHRWWWLSLQTGGSVGFYLFANSFMYQHSLQLESWEAFAIYFGTMFWISSAAFLCFGSMSLLCTLYFMTKLYSTIDPPEEVEENNDELGYAMFDTMARSDHNTHESVGTEVADVQMRSIEPSQSMVPQGASDQDASA